MMAHKRQGRKKGGRNRGYYFRKNRGWFAVEGSQRIPLRYENGEHIKAADADARDIQEAHARHLLERQHAPAVLESITVLEACLVYLAQAKANGAPKTHADRSDTLFDFCFGIPPEFRAYCRHDQFREDESRMRTGHSARVFTLFRKIALNLLNQERSTKRSVRAKRKRAARNPQYLLEVLTSV